MDQRKARFTSLSGLEIARLYGADDLKGWDAHSDLGAPGEFPYTRGVYSTMYRGRLWTMRQFAGFGSAEDTNRRFQYLLQHGQTGLSVAFDMPTLMGLDSDDPLARGEVGHCGVAVSSLADMERLLEGIPLDQVTTSMTINGPAAILFAMYLAVAERRGIPVARLGGTLQNDILKFRAARRLWAREMEQRYHPKDPRSLQLRCHAQTAGCSLMAQQPLNNVVRTTLQALAAVLGGAQSLHTNSMDETLALPTEDSVKLALRTQQILAHESEVTNTVDPLGGAYYVESLTNRLEEGAREYFRRLDQMGGMIRAIEQGFPQREILEASLRYQGEVERKERVIVGVNEYVEPDEPPIPILKIGPEVEQSQAKSLADLRSRRDSFRMAGTLQALQEAAAGDENLMPYLIDAVKAQATLGEICAALKEVFGTYREPVVL